MDYQRPRTAYMVRLLQKLRLAQTERQTNYILIGLISFCVVVTVYLTGIYRYLIPHQYSVYIDGKKVEYQEDVPPNATIPKGLIESLPHRP